MIPRIKKIEIKPDFCLLVSFEDGRQVLYNVGEDIKQVSAFRALLTEPGLFEQAQLDQSRTCVYWNERIDLPSDAIYRYGQVQFMSQEDLDSIVDDLLEKRTDAYRRLAK